jgi:hypothetical protein
MSSRGGCPAMELHQRDLNDIIYQETITTPAIVSLLTKSVVEVFQRCFPLPLKTKSFGR